MNPAFSVIVFTTLSGAGYGLLAWLGLTICTSGPALYGQPDNGFLLWLIPVAMAMLVTGIVLTAIGLISSTFHLGQPQRAWRAFSQWRTSWLSREGLASLLTYVPALGMLALLWAAHGSRVWAERLAAALPWLGGALAIGSLVTVVCTAMIYASLKPVPAWRHRLVAPVYVVFALLTGNLLTTPLSMYHWNNPFGSGHLIIPSPSFIAIPSVLAIALAVMKWVYWRDIDRIELPTREAATALEGFGKVVTFERPHTEANYLTHEMGFVLARKHSRKLRVVALVLFAAIPPLASLAAIVLPALMVVALWTAALAAIAGAIVERWLFFAEARHMVMLYY